MINEKDETVVYDKEQMAAVPAGSVVKKAEVKEPVKEPVKARPAVSPPVQTQRAPLPPQSSFTRPDVSGMVDSKQIKDRQK